MSNLNARAPFLGLQNRKKNENSTLNANLSNKISNQAGNYHFFYFFP